MKIYSITVLLIATLLFVTGCDEADIAPDQDAAVTPDHSTSSARTESKANTYEFSLDKNLNPYTIDLQTANFYLAEDYDLRYANATVNRKLLIITDGIRTGLGNWSGSTWYVYIELHSAPNETINSRKFSFHRENSWTDNSNQNYIYSEQVAHFATEDYSVGTSTANGTLRYPTYTVTHNMSEYLLDFNNGNDCLKLDGTIADGEIVKVEFKKIHARRLHNAGPNIYGTASLKFTGTIQEVFVYRK